nr:retrovirus-related Pol polyprotein from transposon TNT 1-94 [Tanacetum cinerariifolium]
MSRDVLTVGSTMMISLLYRGEYSQWIERFMNYLEEQTDGEAMINCIKNGDQPLPCVTQVSIAGTASTEQPPLKDKSMWSDQEKKIDRLARSFLIQGLPNDINKTAKDLWDALAKHMLGSEYGEQDRKVAVLYDYSKDNYELNFKFLNNLQPEWKQYATMMRQNKNLMDINIDALYNILKQNQGDVNDAMGLKKKTVVVTFDPLALIAEKTKSANKKQEFVKSNDKKVEKKDDEKKRDMSKVQCYNCKKKGHFAKYCKKVKVNDYEYYKTKMLLAKKDKDEQVLLAEDQAWMESSSASDQEINANMVFMVQIKKVLSDSEASSSSADDKVSEVSYYLPESESESEYETSKYYDNNTTYGLFVNDNDDQEIFHDCENFPENLIESQIDHNESAVDHNDSKGIDKLIKIFNKKIVKCLKCIEKANQQNKDFKIQNKDLQDKYDVLKNQETTFEMKNKELNEQLKVLIEKNDDLLAQTNVLKDQLQVKHVVIDTHVECQEKYAKLEAERYEYKIRYSAYFDNDKQHRKQIA